MCANLWHADAEHNFMGPVLGPNVQSIPWIVAHAAPTIQGFCLNTMYALNAMRQPKGLG